MSKLQTAIENKKRLRIISDKDGGWVLSCVHEGRRYTVRSSKHGRLARQAIEEGLDWGLEDGEKWKNDTDANVVSTYRVTHDIIKRSFEMIRAVRNGVPHAIPDMLKVGDVWGDMREVRLKYEDL